MSLANVPGLGAYIEQSQRNRQQPLAEMAQAGALVGLQQKMQAQQKALAFESEVAALGPQPDQGALTALAAKYAPPADVLKTQQASLDRQATAEATRATARQNAEDRRSAAEQMITFRYDSLAQQGINEDQKRALEVRRQSELEANNKRHDETLRMLGVLRADATANRAPSLSEIVDPSDSTRLLKIDTRLYKGGSAGAPGVIGIAGKEPSSAKREEKEGQGKDLLRTELDNLRSHYGVLNEARAIPSSDRSGTSNAAAWVQGSAVGQLGGRILGTKEQDARNQIQSGRLRIMNAIKNATGMSAQQLNSNVELKTWLDSLTSMTGSYESNAGIIDSIEKAFLTPKGAGGPWAGAGAPPAGVDAAIWGAMTPQEKALWQR